MSTRIDSTTTISIRAASRLSFTLIDLNGEGGRRNGMASLSIADPSFAATLYKSSQNVVISDQYSQQYEEDILQFIEKIQQQWHTANVKVVIDTGIPTHEGFGSKTTTLLSIGKAYAALNNLNIATETLAKLASRAGTSGASVNLIDHGGYLVDGGHANPEDFAQDPKRYLLPSKFAKPAIKPPILINMTFPSWPILIMISQGNKLYDETELTWFNQTLPIPKQEAMRTAHHVLMHLSTAIAEEDYVAFCKAVNTITYEHYFKKKQIETQPDSVQTIFKETPQQTAIDAIGMSAFGPMCYAFTQDPTAALRYAEDLKQRGLIKRFWLTTAQNHPCQLTQQEKARAHAG